MKKTQNLSQRFGLFVYRKESGDMPPNHCKSEEHQKHCRTKHEEAPRSTRGKHEGSGGARNDCP